MRVALPGGVPELPVMRRVWRAGLAARGELARAARRRVARSALHGRGLAGQRRVREPTLFHIFWTETAEKTVKCYPFIFEFTTTIN